MDRRLNALINMYCLGDKKTRQPEQAKNKLMKLYQYINTKTICNTPLLTRKTPSSTKVKRITSETGSYAKGKQMVLYKPVRNKTKANKVKKKLNKDSVSVKKSPKTKMILRK